MAGPVAILVGCVVSDGDDDDDIMEQRNCLSGLLCLSVWPGRGDCTVVVSNASGLETDTLVSD